MGNERTAWTGGVIWFDGSCAFCQGAVRFVARRDPAGYFRFAPSASPDGLSVLARCGLAGTAPRSIVFVDGDRAYRESDAVLRIARRLAFPWWLLAGLLVVPRPLRDAAYRIVAALRHRLARRATSCDRLPPEIRSRLL